MVTRRCFAGVRKSSSGQAPVLAAILFLLLIPTTMIIAENATTNITGLISNTSISNISLSPENTSLNISDILPPEDNQTGNETSENATAWPPEKTTLPEGNKTLPKINATINITNPQSEINITFPENQTNTTIPEENITAPENENQILHEEPLGPDLIVELQVPKQANRNKPFLVSAEIRNTGDDESTNVELEWVLSDGFSIVEGDATHRCDIPAGASCLINVTVTVSLYSELGEHEIKALVRYHD